MPTQLRNDTKTIREIVNDFLEGRIVVPEFQRDNIWKPSKAFVGTNASVSAKSMDTMTSYSSQHVVPGKQLLIQVG